MLPDKMLLRKAIKGFSKPPKFVVSYFQGEEVKDLAAVGKVLTIEREAIYALLYYSSEKLEYVTFISKQIDILTVKVTTPVKWWKSLDNFSLPHYIVNKGYTKEITRAYLRLQGIFKFFDISDRNSKPIDEIKSRYERLKEKRSFESRKRNIQQRNEEFNSLFQPIPEDFREWALTHHNIGIFNTHNRHKGFCTECNTHFDSAEALFCGHTAICPNCGLEMVMKTPKSIKWCYEDEYQVLGKTIDGRLVIHHFFVEKYFRKQELVKSYTGIVEYERDIVENNGDFSYHIQRQDTFGTGYMAWYHRKMLKGCMWSMRNVCYDSGLLYRENIKEVLSDSAFKYSALDFLPIDSKLRVEDFIFDNYTVVPEIMEGLIKAGFSRLALLSNGRDWIKAFPKMTLKEIFRGFNPEHIEMIRNTVTSPKEIGVLRNYLEQRIALDKLKEVLSFGETIYGKDGSYRFAKDFLFVALAANISIGKLLRYFRGKPRNHFSLYADYVKWTVDLSGKPPQDKLLPSNLKTAHDEMYKMYKQNEKMLSSYSHDQLNARCKVIADYLVSTGLCDSFKDYHILIPSCIEDFIREGVNMNICVGGASYYKEQSSKSGIVFFVRKADNPQKSFCCCEGIISNGRFILKQAHLYNNEQADSETTRVAAAFCKKLGTVLDVRYNHYELPENVPVSA